MATDSECLMSRGIRFHSVGPHTLKAHLHRLHSVIVGCAVGPADHHGAHILFYVLVEQAHTGIPVQVSAHTYIPPAIT